MELRTLHRDDVSYTTDGLLEDSSVLYTLKRKELRSASVASLHPGPAKLVDRILFWLRQTWPRNLQLPGKSQITRLKLTRQNDGRVEALI